MDRSLVVAEQEAGEGRYRFLETIRQYAQERLLDSGEIVSVRDRHRDWFVALAERSAVELEGNDRADWMGRLARESENVRAALVYSQSDEAGAESELRLVAALGGFWMSLPNLTEAREHYPHALARSQGLPLRFRAAALKWAGNVGIVSADVATSEPLLEEAVALFRQVGDARLLADALVRLSYPSHDRGEWNTAKAFVDEALSLARESNDRRVIAGVLDQQGLLLRRSGELAAARSALEEAQAIRRELGDASPGNCEANLGWIALSEGRLGDARSLFEQVVESARSVTPPNGVPLLLGLAGLGDVARAEGDLVTAKQLYLECLKAVIPTGVSNLVVMVLGRIAGHAVSQGTMQRASRLFGVVQAYYARAGYPVPWYPQPLHQQDLAVVQALLGEEAFARAWAAGQAMTLERAVEYALKDEA